MRKFVIIAAIWSITPAATAQSVPADFNLRDVATAHASTTKENGPDPAKKDQSRYLIEGEPSRAKHVAGRFVVKLRPATLRNPNALYPSTGELPRVRD